MVGIFARNHKGSVLKILSKEVAIDILDVAKLCAIYQALGLAKDERWKFIICNRDVEIFLYDKLNSKGIYDLYWIGKGFLYDIKLLLNSSLASFS